MKKFVKTIIEKNVKNTVDQSINHILVIDCSGSMSYDLPKIRKQLKNKLPSLVKEKDTVSLVWFSGKEEFGRLVDMVKVNNAYDLNRLNVAIDRWLKPIGTTGFVEPIYSVCDLIRESENDGAYSMMFLTDGCDNEWSKSEIMNAISELEPVLSNAVFVEYGYYCNHALLEEMASEIGGSVVFAEDFDSYDPIFDNVITKNISSTKRIEVEVDNPMFDFVYSISDDGVSTYKVENNKVKVREDVDAIYYFKDEEVEKDTSFIPEILKGLSVLVLKRKGSFIKDVLHDTGMYHLYNKFSNCFGKQALYDFQKTLTANVDNSSNENIVDKSNSYSVVNLLRFLQMSKSKIAIDKMKYNRIGRATVQEETLSEEEREKIADAIKLATTSDEIKEIMENSVKLLSSKKKIKFVAKTKSLPVSNMTWNDTRPNVSLLFKIDGYVELPDDCPSTLPKQFDTFIYRNYAIIRDGLINVEELPVILDDLSFFSLQKLGVIDNSMKFIEGEVVFINLMKLPLINENMVKEVSAKDYFEKTYDLYAAKSNLKVYKHYKDMISPESKSEGIIDKYSNEDACYLSNLGITDKGFTPKVQVVKGNDFYMATELVAKIKGMSSLPSVNAVIKKKNEGKKLNAADKLVNNCIEICESNRSSMDQDVFVEWINNGITKAEYEVKNISAMLAQTMFAIIVGQTWFNEFETIEDCSMTLKLDGIDEFYCSMELKDTSITI